PSVGGFFALVVAPAFLAGGCGHGNGQGGVPVSPPPAAAPAPSFPEALDDPPLPPCQRTVPVAGSAALAPALTAAAPGDCLLLADGEYSFPVIGARASADKPIVIRAQNRGQAVI